MTREAERLVIKHLLIQSTILGGILNIIAKDSMKHQDIATIVNENNSSLEYLLTATTEHLKNT